MYLNIPQTIFRYFTIIPHPREFYQPSSETPYPQVAVETSARCSLCKYLLASFAERAFTVPSDFPVPREASPATRRLPARGDAESHILTGRDTCNANALKKSVSRAAFFDQPAFTRGCSRINSAEGPCRGEKGTLLLLASTREHWSDAEREAFPAASARSRCLRFFRRTPFRASGFRYSKSRRRRQEESHCFVAKGIDGSWRYTFIRARTESVSCRRAGPLSGVQRGWFAGWQYAGS